MSAKNAKAARRVLSTLRFPAVSENTPLMPATPINHNRRIRHLARSLGVGVFQAARVYAARKGYSMPTIECVNPTGQTLEDFKERLNFING
ncbi:hypothetical protein GGR92_000028 [Spirosoma lacussanchae]|uniref:hypothetical protein n=1 Tax=Spirosoma lacussanchae TaxID=1884249 RepID=UPI0011098665|nr:hypothetical protein [Spirosoma lacussanchae]